MKLPLLAQRIFGVPLMIEPGKLEVILRAVGPRVLGVDAVEVELDGAPAPAALIPAAATLAGNEKQPKLTIADGVAVIPIQGTLVHRSSWMDSASGLSSYQSISEQLQAALSDPKVRSILLSIDSPGGEVGGVFDLAEQIFQARGVKPITAVASDQAASAAYLLGSAAEEFYASEAGVVGSIGVVLTHVDTSAAEEKAGVKVTQIHAGAFKVDGTPHAPLGDASRDRLQAHTNEIYGLMTSKIARNRGIAEKAVRGTEAGVFIGQAGVAAGLVNGIRSSREALSSLAARPRQFVVPGAMAASVPASGGKKGVVMATDKQNPEGGEDGGEVISLEELKKLRAENAKLSAERDASAATIAGLKKGEKDKLIAQAQSVGRIVPANLDAVSKLAEHMEAPELKAYLDKLPTQTHAKAIGVADVTAPPAGKEAASEVSADEAAMLKRMGLSVEEVNKYDQVRSAHLGTMQFELKDGELVDAKTFSGRA